MISGLQIALKNAIDVIAPPATSLQDFTYHWKQIMNFYVNHLTDSKVPVEITGIPRHLDRLLELLLEEEKHGSEPGPCLEYLLQHRLLDLLATLASAETPPGMRLVCLSFLRKLLTRSKHPLLHHAAVYGPIQRLIAICNGSIASPIEHEEIQFLLCVCFLVCKYPHVTNIVNEYSNVQRECGVFQCDYGKAEIEKVTYIPVKKLKTINPLFKPLNTQAITLVNPDLFKISAQSSYNNSLEKLSMPSEEIQDKPSKHKRNTSSRSNSSTQSSGSSSREAELISQSSSPFTQKPNENIPNNIPYVGEDTQESLNLYKVLEQEESSSEYDPVLAAINDFKDLRINEEYASSNSDVKSRSSKHDITLSELASPENSKCLLLDSLKSYVNSADNTIRIRACEGIMVLASLDDPLFAEVVAKSDLASVLTKRLEVLFNLIPAHVEPSEVDDIEVTWGLDSPPILNDKKFPGCRKVAAFFMWLDFCAQLSREAQPDVADVLAQTIRISFFEKIFTPALSAHHAVLITALITKCLRDIPSSPLSIEMGRWMVGARRDPNIPEVWSCPVIHRLIESCCTESDDLTLETLKLFEEAVERRDEHILHCLILMYLNTRGYYDTSAADSAIASWSDEEDEREREKRGSMDLASGICYSRTLAPSNIHRILNCFLSLVPRQLQTESDSHYGRYMGDWEKQYSRVVKNCSLLAWPLEAVTVDDSASSHSRTDSDNCSNRFYPGPFLSMLLERISNIPKQKYDINFEVTGLISKLALLPHPYLHEFLLNPLIPLAQGNKNLFICLQRVVKQLMHDVPKLTDYKQALKETRLRLFDNCCMNDPSQVTILKNCIRPKEEEILLESVILTEEFCKELAAIAYVKYHHST
ncbi:FHF complex subunit HOOK interacting protein 2A-like isoform X2 [Phymastichus coffea]|uniref:FHF complex subunit HOOK interacting protein 2A-like isoform X2 n=1 Tax=Phymastichus coffea TaxID=108790 RepID=UPI00273AA346|nr:FHF complex subunit HOOK interacting protein 2A-like isoform X2 [Phymastichus coffea]